MTEDQEWDLLEQRLKREQAAKETDYLQRANLAAAEFMDTQTAELLAITTPRQMFIYGYRFAVRDASNEKK